MKTDELKHEKEIEGKRKKWMTPHPQQKKKIMAISPFVFVFSTVYDKVVYDQTQKRHFFIN